MDERSVTRTAPSYYSRGKQVIKGAIVTALMLAGGWGASLLSRSFFRGVSAQPSPSSSDGPSDALVPSNTENALASTSLAVSSLSSSSESTVSSSSIFAELEQPGVDVVPEEVTAPKFDTSDLQYPGSLPLEETPVSTAEAKATKQDVEVEDDEEISELDTSDPRYHVSSLGGSAGSSSVQCSLKSTANLADYGNGWGSGVNSGSSLDRIGTVVTVVPNFFGANDTTPSLFVTMPGMYGSAGGGVLIRQPWLTDIDPSQAPTSQITQFRGEKKEDNAGTTAYAFNEGNSTCLVFGSVASPNGKKWSGRTYVVCHDEAMPNPMYLSGSVLQINGKATYDLSSSGLGSVLDVRNGRNRLVISSSGALGDQGVTDIIVSPLASLGREFNLSAPNPNLFRIVGDIDDTSGSEVSGGFNFTGRNEANLAITAPQTWIGGPGKAYVALLWNITGGGSTSATSLNDGERGITIVGGSNAHITKAKFIDDINQNGLPELVITTSQNAQGGSKAFVVCDGTNLPGEFDLDHIDSLNVITISVAGKIDDVAAADFFGNDVEGLVIGVSSGDGAVYYVVPKSSWPKQISLDTPPSSVDVYKWIGPTNSNAGTSISVGRLNDARYDDIVIGGPNQGTVLVFGGCRPESVALINNSLTIHLGETKIIDETNIAAANQAPGVYYRVESIKDGYFSLVGSNEPIPGFSVGDVTKKTVQITSTGSLSYQIVLDDGLRQSSPQNATVQNLGPPSLLTDATLSVNQNQIVDVQSTVIQAAAVGADPREINIRFNLENGWFLLRPGMLQVNNVTQEVIFDNRLAFQAANSQVSPSGYIYLECNGFVVGPIGLKFNYDSFPKLEENNPVVVANQTRVITQDMLWGSHATRGPASLAIQVYNLHGGVFVFGNTSTTTIPLSAIAARNVSFISFGVVPSFDLNVVESDGALQSPIVQANIELIIPPVVTKKEFIVGIGKRARVDPSMLDAIDPNPNSDSQNLILDISKVKDCFFDSAIRPGVPITTVRLNDITKGLIRFTATGANPQFAVSASTSDGVAISDAQNASITCVLAPTLKRNNLVIGANQAVVLDRTVIDVEDSKYGPEDITVDFSETNNCQVTLTSNPFVTVTSCSLAQIVRGEITIIAGDGSALGFTLTVSNPVLAAAPVAANVDYHLAPVMVSEDPIDLVQDIPIPAKAMFKVFTNENASTVSIVLENVLHGRFYSIVTPTSHVTNITLQDIDSYRFKQDNSYQRPTIVYSMHTPQVTTRGASLDTVLHTTPVLRTNRYTFFAETIRQITSNDLSATSFDVLASKLFIRFSNMSGGCFVLGKTPNCSLAISEVGQDRVIAGDVYFFPYGKQSPSFLTDVTDGWSRSKQQPAVITFVLPEPQDSMQNNIVYYSVAFGFGAVFFLLRQYLGYRAKKTFVNDDSTDFVCQKLIEKIKFSGVLGYLSKTKSAELRSAVATLLTRLTNEDIGIDFNVATMSIADKDSLVEIIADQIKETLIPKRSCCARTGRFFANFCVAEFTPELFMAYMDKVVTDVKKALQNYKANQEIERLELPEEQRQATATVNPLHSSNSSVTVEVIEGDNEELEKAIKEYKA